MPLVSASAGALLATALAIGVAPENLHAQSNMQHLCWTEAKVTSDKTMVKHMFLHVPSKTEPAFGPAACYKLCRFGTAGRLIAFPFVAFDHSGE